MLLTGFPAGAWATNCYVAAAGPGEECVVVDPGHEAADGVAALVREHRLKPVAVLLTHGHFDHTFSVVPVCGAHGVPAYLHPADRHMLRDPAGSVGLPPGTPIMGGLTVGEPDDLRVLSGGDTVTLAGLDFVVDHAPGHTKGSVTFRLGEDVLLSGDLLFAGSIGRTDLPGGDYAEIVASLARVVLPLPDEMAVLPGHGPATTVGRERATNPFLSEAGSTPAAPRRGL